MASAKFFLALGVLALATYANATYWGGKREE